MRRLWVQQTLAFSVVVIVIMSFVVIWINRSTATEFQKYITLRDLSIGDRETPMRVVQDLATYHDQQQSWDGVESLLAQGVFFNADWNNIFLGATLSDDERTNLSLREPLVAFADAKGRIIYQEGRGSLRQKLSPRERGNAWPITDTDSGEEIGYLLLFFSVTQPLDKQEQQFLDRVQQVLLVNTALAVVLIVGVSALLGRRLNAPLQRLVGAARAVASGDLDQQVAVSGSVEIAQVGQAFNEMTSALKEAETLRQNMVADVAHELRTPLSVLQGNLWAILNDAYPLEKVEIARLYDETRLLSRLVEDLRDLALADAGQLNLNLQPTDVSNIIRQTVDNFSLVAEAQHVALTSQLPDEFIVVHADADRVAQVLRNLLVNALRHTPPGGEVTVAITAAEDAVEIAVSDTGEGIAPEHIAYVFERFWRADPARTKSDADEQLGSGTGLGLAVAQSLVEAQGGRIWVEGTRGEGAVFRFTLPRAQRVG